MNDEEHTKCVELIKAVEDQTNSDIICYIGEISRTGYSQTCEALESRENKRPNALLVLCTLGGDPHAGYRIARAIRHHYAKMYVMIPDHCKSAGTLIVVGASEVIIADRGELGPLDVQFLKGDELFEYGSGLDLVQALASLEGRALASFKRYLMEIRIGARLSTRLASELAIQLADGLYGPIAAQIDPMRLGEMQRATEIALDYGARLDAYDKNLRPKALDRLVLHYPAHGFVIDRREAKELFHRVRAPSEEELVICQVVRDSYQKQNKGSVVYWFDDFLKEPAAVPSPADGTELAGEKRSGKSGNGAHHEGESATIPPANGSDAKSPVSINGNSGKAKRSSPRRPKRDDGKGSANSNE